MEISFEISLSGPKFSPAKKHKKAQKAEEQPAEDDRTEYFRPPLINRNAVLHA